MPIETVNLGIRPGSEWLWRGLNLRVEPGEIIGLLGRNGSGKTTLLRTLAGLRPPDEGTVTPLRPVGYVPQSSLLSFAFSAREVVVMGRVHATSWYGGPSRHDWQLADQTMAETGCHTFAGRPFTELSGGEKHMVLLARALVTEARLLLLDEPAAALDLDNQNRLLLLLERVARERKLSVILSSHNPDHLFAVARRAVLLRRGVPPETGPVAALLDAARLTEFYGLPVEVIERDNGNQRTRHAIPKFGFE